MVAFDKVRSKIGNTSFIVGLWLWLGQKYRKTHFVVGLWLGLGWKLRKTPFTLWLAYGYGQGKNIVNTICGWPLVMVRTKMERKHFVVFLW